MANEPSKLPPPYVSYGIFRSTIDVLAKSTVPSGPLDRHVLDKLSGADYGGLISALRFLGFVDADRKATEDYKELLKSSLEKNQKPPTDFKVLLLAALTSSYDPILGKVDLEHGTIAEVEKAFREYGVTTAAMLSRTVRFCVKAYKEAGLKVSHFITKPKPRVSRGKNGGEKIPPRIKPPLHDDLPETPSGSERMPVPGVPGGFIQYPVALTDAHCDLLTAMIAVLRTYAKGRPGGKGKTP